MASELPQVRRRPTRVKLGDAQRNSNVVRASVLETALELGLGENSTVADWIFNNPLSEESEDLHLQPDARCRLESSSDPVPDVAEVITPTFTSGSNSTSDESSLNSPGNGAPSAAVVTIQVHTHKPSTTEPPHVHFDDFPVDQLQFSPFALSLSNAQLEETGGKLLGKLSPERSRSQDDGFHGNPDHESPSPGPADSGYTSEGQYLSKGKARKSKDKTGKAKGTKGPNPKSVDVSKSGEKDGDYASDGGYLSASSNKSQGKSPSRVKSRAIAFFRRRPKKSGRASDDEDEDSIPPVPVIPTLPTPSSPRLLERRVAPSSPTRSGFSPLTLNLTNPPASPPRRRVSKSPPPHARATSPQRLDYSPAPHRPASPQVVAAPASAVTFPLPPSLPGTPLSTTSFPSVSSGSTQLGTGIGSSPRSLAVQSSRQHLGIPPPAPPPTLPLPQPPPSPAISFGGLLPPVPATPTTPYRRSAPARPIPVVPGPTQPLSPRRVASPLRPLLSPRTTPPALPNGHNGKLRNGLEGDQLNGKEVAARQRTGAGTSAGFGGTPAFLQRRIQHGPPPSPRHPPPDVPLPPSPNPASSVHPRTPVGTSSKFHEHLSSVSSVPISHILSTPSMSPVPSTATLSGSSSGPSVRSSHISSASERSRELATRDSLNVVEYSRPTTSASSASEISYGQPITSTWSRPPMALQPQLSDQSDTSSSIYSPTTHSVSTYDDDDVDVDEEDDDASMYPAEDKTAGRRTMYLLEHDELDENGDEIVISGGPYWSNSEHPPPLPPIPNQPRPGYF